MAKKMTLRQRILKWLYPATLLVQRIRGHSRIRLNKEEMPPRISLYTLSIELSNGQKLSLEKFRGKKLLIVNTASDCAYTAQYAELQKLYQHSKEDLEIIAFPSNEFKQQERGDDEAIQKFCGSGYGIRFLLAKKTSVLKGLDQHPVYQWLSSKENNGWNEEVPAWNFSKYLVNEKGWLTHYFDPAISPLSTEMIRAVHQ